MLESMGATEDAAWRSLIAGQKPADIAGRATYPVLGQEVIRSGWMVTIVLSSDHWAT